LLKELFLTTAFARSVLSSFHTKHWGFAKSE
jgi:hypothetical protein